MYKKKEHPGLSFKQLCALGRVLITALYTYISMLKASSHDDESLQSLMYVIIYLLNVFPLHVAAFTFY